MDFGGVFIFIFVIFVMLALKGILKKLAAQVGVQTSRRNAPDENMNPKQPFFESVFNSQKRNSAWMETAGEFGLAFLRPKTFDGYPAISGLLKECKVSVYVASGGSSEPPFTVFKINFPKSLYIGLLAAKGMCFKPEAFSGRKRLDAMLESAFGSECRGIALSAFDRTELEKYLTPARCEAVRSFFKTFPDSRLDDDSLTVCFRGVESDPAEMSRVIADALKFALLLGDLSKEPENAASVVKPVAEKLKNESSIPEKHPEPLIGFKPAIQEETPPMDAENREPEAAKEDPPAVPSGSETDSVIQTLFKSAFPGADEKALFDNMKGRSYELEGTLKNAYSFGSDFVFGNRGGVRATLVIGRLESDRFKPEIKAVVCFDKDELKRLRELSGKKVMFAGTALKIESVSREIYFSDGKILKGDAE